MPDIIPYRPTPTSERFHYSDKFVRGYMGPIGSGKSVACCWEIFFRCSIQPKQKDGKRRSRWLVVRNTYRELKRTTIKTWMQWFPEGVCGHYKVSEETFYLQYGDIEAEIMFQALDTADDIGKLLSLEITGAWLNEAREIPFAMLDGLTGRVGRYPRKADGEEEGWCGIIMDTNPPDEDHWWYDLFEVKAVKDKQVAELYEVFKQPPAVFRNKDGTYRLNPDADNLENLRPDYYLNYVAGKDRELIKVYAEGKYGVTRDGKPVYPTYDDEFHCHEFDVDPSLPVYVGWDYGLGGNACLLAQLSPKGQLRIFDEFVAEGMGVYQFCHDIVLPGLAKHGPLRYEHSTGDPTGGNRQQGNETSNLSIINGEDENLVVKMPFVTYPSPDKSNSIDPRINAVKFFLNRLIDKAPGEPARAGILVHPRCATLRRGFIGKYEYKRIQGQDGRYKDQPSKDRYSHIHDALQYCCLGILSHYGMDEEEDDYYRPVQRNAVTGY